MNSYLIAVTDPSENAIESENVGERRRLPSLINVKCRKLKFLGIFVITRRHVGVLGAEINIVVKIFGDFQSKSDN